MRKKIDCIIICFFIIFIILFCLFSYTPSISLIQEDNWNNGKCELDGGRLHYVGTSNKEIYECELCGKKYKFNKIMSYKGDIIGR